MTQAAARLQQGGQRYRDFLSIGSAVIAQALHIARRAAAGDERLAVRRARTRWRTGTRCPTT